MQMERRKFLVLCLFILGFSPTQGECPHQRFLWDYVCPPIYCVDEESTLEFTSNRMMQTADDNGENMVIVFKEEPLYTLQEGNHFVCYTRAYIDVIWICRAEKGRCIKKWRNQICKIYHATSNGALFNWIRCEGRPEIIVFTDSDSGIESELQPPSSDSGVESEFPPPPSDSGVESEFPPPPTDDEHASQYENKEEESDDAIEEDASEDSGAYVQYNSELYCESEEEPIESTAGFLMSQEPVQCPHWRFQRDYICPHCRDEHSTLQFIRSGGSVDSEGKTVVLVYSQQPQYRLVYANKVVCQSRSFVDIIWKCRAEEERCYSVWVDQVCTIYHETSTGTMYSWFQCEGQPEHSKHHSGL